MAAAYSAEQKELEERLRGWRKAEAAKTGKPSFLIFSDTTLHALVVAQPRSMSSLLRVSGIGAEKAERYGAAVIALMTGTAVASDFGEPTVVKVAGTVAPVRTDASPTTKVLGEVSEPAMERVRRASAEEVLTGEQQVLDRRLREWRKNESEKQGLPQFFVLGSSALRSIVLIRPRTLAQLHTISGLGAEKIDKYGAGIVSVCSG